MWMRGGGLDPRLPPEGSRLVSIFSLNPRCRDRGLEEGTDGGSVVGGLWVVYVSV